MTRELKRDLRERIKRSKRSVHGLRAMIRGHREAIKHCRRAIEMERAFQAKLTAI